MIKVAKPNIFQIGDIVSFKGGGMWRYVVTDIIGSTRIKFVAIDDSSGDGISWEWAHSEEGCPYMTECFELVWRYEEND